MGNMVGRENLLKQRTKLWEQEQKKRAAEMLLNPDIPYADGLAAVIDSDKQMHRMSRINHKLRCFKNDGIYQLNRAIADVFGAVVSHEDKGPSAGEQTIQMVDIELADGRRVKAPFGEISLESLGEGSSININYDEDSHELIVTGKCQSRFMPMMDDIIEATKHYLATESIYKSQAIEITDINNPKLMSLAGIEGQLMVLSKKTEYDLQPIRARINNPEFCIKQGIPLKFGCLLEGNYGVGKTLLAFKLALEAIQNNWIFIYLKDPHLLAETLRLCKVIDKSGHGVVLFLEDIDQVTRGDRDASMQDILNTLDGGDTKNMNVISIFTTNHIELIEPTFLRGKRIGTIISMDALDKDTANKFITESFKIGNYTIVDPIDSVCEFIAQHNIAPAFMAEIIEKVKAGTIYQNTSEVTAEQIKFSVESYLHQVELAKKKEISKSPGERLAEALIDIVGSKEASKYAHAACKMLEDHDCDLSMSAYLEE